MFFDEPRSKRRFYFLIIFTVAFIAISWFAISETNVRKNCRQMALNESLKIINNPASFEQNTNKRLQLQKDLQENIYLKCLDDAR